MSSWYVVVSVPKSKKKCLFYIQWNAGAIIRAAQIELIETGMDTYTMIHEDIVEVLEIPSNQELKYAVPNCTVDSILEKEPCSVCGILVHHMCSNSILESCASNH